MLGNGYVRVVWASNEDGNSARNVHGATFFLGNPNACLARTVILDASKTYGPTCYHDATATMTPPMKFVIPATIPVTAGNSANGWVYLSFKSGNNPTTVCKYKGGLNSSHPTGAVELAKASKYVFYSCDAAGCGHDPHAGEQVTADWVKLHVDSGDSHKPSTAVRATLTEVCAPASAPPPPPKPKKKHGHHHGHGNGHDHHGNGHGYGHDGDHDDDDDDHDGHHGNGHDGDDDDDHGSRHDDLVPEVPESTVGCSSAGGAPTVLMLLAVAAWMLMSRRRVAVKVSVRR